MSITLEDIQRMGNNSNVSSSSLLKMYQLLVEGNLYYLGQTGCSVIDSKLNISGSGSNVNPYLLDAIAMSDKSDIEVSRPLLTNEARSLVNVLNLQGNFRNTDNVDEEAEKYYKSLCGYSKEEVIEGSDKGEKLDNLLDEDKEVEEEEKAGEEDKDDVEDVEIDDATAMYSSFISNKVAELMESYSSLYKVCYENKRPMGVLTPEGIYTLSGKLKSTNPESKAELSMVFRVINETIGPLDGVTGFEHKVSPKEIENTEGKPLYINYHLANMYGYFGNRTKKSNNYREFSSYMSERTKKILRLIVSKLPKEVKENDRKAVEGVILQYIANLKNCILVDEYKPGVVLKLRICLDSAVYTQEYNKLNVGVFENVVQSGYLFKRQSTVDCPSKANDVFYLNFIVDANTYYNAPLFAYEALPLLKEQGIELSWDNILIGKDVKDELVFGHFGAEQKTIYNIMAGSGSGKGVMTLSLLASALAANIPVMYADCKPDMAQVLWDTAGGSPVLAFDGDDQGTLNPVETEYNIFQYYNDSLPEPIKKYLCERGLQKKLVKTYSYLRCIHLAYLISVMRKEKGVSPNDYILFIFDEIGRVSEQVMDLTVALRGEGDPPKGGFIEDRITELKLQGASKGDIARDPSIEYAKGFVNYAIGVISKIVTAKTAELRLSNSKLLFIWQPDWLKKAGLASITSKSNKYYFMSVLYKLASDSNTVKFAGKGSEGAGPIGMAEAYNKSSMNAQLFDSFRYFALAESGEVTGASKVFRPFLLLNDCSPKSAAKCVATNNLAHDKVYRDGNENDIIPEIGFPQYVSTLLNGNIKDPLCRSWGIAEEALEELGYDRDVYKFMFDVSDIRLNLAVKDEELDSRSMSSLLKQAEEEDDFSDEEKQRSSEQARLQLAMGDYDDDLGIDSEDEYGEDEEIDLDEPIILKESSTNNTEVMSETQMLINELSKRLGIDVASSLGITDTGNDFEEYSEPPMPQRGENVSNLEEGLGDINLNSNEPEIYADSMMQLVQIITNDVINKFGGLQRFNIFQLKGGSIAVNKTFYRCKINKNVSSNMPYDISREINAGNITSLFDYNALLYCPNLGGLEIDSLDFWYSTVAPVLGVSLDDLDKIFYKVFPNLRVLRVGGKSYTRRDLENAKQELKEKAKKQNEFAGKKNISSLNMFVYNKMTKGSYSLLRDSIHSEKLRGAKKAGAIFGSGALLAGSGAVNAITGVANMGWKFIKGVKNLFD